MESRPEDPAKAGVQIPGFTPIITIQSGNNHTNFDVIYL